MSHDVRLGKVVGDRAKPGHDTNGNAKPGHDTNGNARPGHDTNGNAKPGHYTEEFVQRYDVCQPNCCGLRPASGCSRTFTNAGPGKAIAASRAPRRSFGSSMNQPLPPNASIILS
jgi:hypothetical protein